MLRRWVKKIFNPGFNNNEGKSGHWTFDGRRVASFMSLISERYSSAMAIWFQVVHKYATAQEHCTRIQGQLSLLPSAGREMSTGQSAVMLFAAGE